MWVRLLFPLPFLLLLFVSSNAPPLTANRRVWRSIAHHESLEVEQSATVLPPEGLHANEEESQTELRPDPTVVPRAANGHGTAELRPTTADRATTEATVSRAIVRPRRASDSEPFVLRDASPSTVSAPSSQREDAAVEIRGENQIDLVPVATVSPRAAQGDALEKQPDRSIVQSSTVTSLQVPSFSLVTPLSTTGIPRTEDGKLDSHEDPSLSTVTTFTLPSPRPSSIDEDHTSTVTSPQVSATPSSSHDSTLSPMDSTVSSLLAEQPTSAPSRSTPIYLLSTPSSLSSIDEQLDDEVTDTTTLLVRRSTVTPTTVPSRLPPSRVAPLPVQSVDGDAGSDVDSAEELSSSELKIQLEKAVEQAKLTKDALDAAEKELTERTKETSEPDRDFDAKQKLWETAESEAIEMEKGWKADVSASDTADAEYGTAKYRLDDTILTFTQEKEKLTKFPETINKAKEDLAAVQDRPNQLIKLKQAKTDKETGKPALEASVKAGGVLFKAEKDRSDELKSAVRIAEDHQLLLNACRKQGADCSSLETKQKPLNTTATKAQIDFEAAHNALRSAQRELATFGKDLKAMTASIELLEKDCKQPKYDQDVAAAKEAVSELERKEREQPDVVIESEKEMKLAAKEEIRQLIARDVALEKVEHGEPSEIGEARTRANHARFALDSARELKSSKDAAVETAKSEVAHSRSAHTGAESALAALKARYETAKRKEADSKKGSNTVLIGGLTGGILLVLVAVVVGVLVCRSKKLCCFGKTNDGARPANAAWWQFWSRCSTKKGADTHVNSRTPSTNQSHGESTTETPLVNAAKAPTVAITHERPGGVPEPPKPTMNGQATSATTTPFQLPQMRDLDAAPGDPIPPPNPDVFTPGEQPYRIPAKHFKWCGPLKRRTRWHGEPIHDFDGVEGVKKVDRIWFDPTGNTATEIGQSEIIEDAGPASDSNRSEWLNNLDEWEANHKIYMAQLAAEKEKANAPTKVEEPKEVDAVAPKDEGMTGNKDSKEAKKAHQNKKVPTPEKKPAPKEQISAVKEKESAKGKSKKDSKGSDDETKPLLG